MQNSENLFLPALLRELILHYLYMKSRYKKIWGGIVIEKRNFRGKYGIYGLFCSGGRNLRAGAGNCNAEKAGAVSFEFSGAYDARGNLHHVCQRSVGIAGDWAGCRPESGQSFDKWNPWFWRGCAVICNFGM